MTSIADILERIRTYSPDANLAPVMSAYLLAARAHAGQKRKSGEPYLNHPLEVAEILADMRMDTDTIATALLHDALEDNPITKEEMEREIGAEITELVDGVTKIGKLKYRSKEELAAENFRKMMLAMSKDLRVILVKLADRLHNMRTLEHHSVDKQKEISQETVEIFVPIANRLGLTRLKSELEDLCFRYLDPEGFAEIKVYLEATQTDRDGYTQRVVKHLQELLAKEGVSGQVSGRAKHTWSIRKKMVAQHLEVAKVPDLLAFRVIVDTVGQCYAVLGVIHGRFPPIPDRIKDYIARPKANGYQSLHTTVLGPEACVIEVQIRTRDMHSIAEEGIAAHWRYKEGRLALTRDDVARIAKIRELFETAQETENATDFMESLKVEFYSDEIFVFTPAGDVKNFPAGSTTLDFAYAVHTDVGNRCVGAKVNGRMVPLRYTLKSGDTIEILTSPNQKPSRDWLEIARSGRAIQKIRRTLRDEEKELGMKLGHDLLEAELKRFGWSIARAKTEGRIAPLLEERNEKDPEALFVELARGQLPLAQVVRRILPDGLYEARTERPQGTGLTSIFGRWRTKSESPVLISGAEGVLVTYARCCAPLPGEPVVGYITRGRGITVHRADCDQLGALEPDRRVAVEWDPGNEHRHSGSVQIVCADKPGMLSNISKVCEQMTVNISKAEARTLGDHRAVCTLEISVRDLDELQRVIKNLQKVKGVESVSRVTAD